MVIFNSYVRLPEGISDSSLVVSVSKVGQLVIFCLGSPSDHMASRGEHWKRNQEAKVRWPRECHARLWELSKSLAKTRSPLKSVFILMLSDLSKVLKSVSQVLNPGTRNVSFTWLISPGCFFDVQMKRMAVFDFRGWARCDESMTINFCTMQPIRNQRCVDAPWSELWSSRP